jgi:hypothetical protein
MGNSFGLGRKNRPSGPFVTVHGWAKTASRSASQRPDSVRAIAVKRSLGILRSRSASPIAAAQMPCVSMALTGSASVAADIPKKATRRWRPGYAGAGYEMYSAWHQPRRKRRGSRPGESTSHSTIVRCTIMEKYYFKNIPKSKNYLLILI